MNITATYLDDMTRRCGTDGSGNVVQRFYSCAHGDHEHVVAVSVKAVEKRVAERGTFYGEDYDDEMDATAEAFALAEAARIIAEEAVT